MAITSWKGGKTGNETMPEGTTSMYYTEIYREIPNLYSTYPAPPHGIGYYQGIAVPPYDEHTTKLAYKEESLIVEINGTVAEIDETGPSSGTFKITSNLSGYVRVKYLPYDTAKYFKKNTITNIVNTPFRSIVIPSKRIHLNEIIEAINSVADRIGTARRRFSTAGFTGYPTKYVSGVGVEPNTPVLEQLLTEIGEHLIYLYNYALVSLSLPVVPESQFTYDYKHVTSNTIQQFREDINILENALDVGGV